jgi:hypothetical protein
MKLLSHRVREVEGHSTPGAVKNYNYIDLLRVKYVRGLMLVAQYTFLNLYFLQNSDQLLVVFYLSHLGIKN